MIDKGQAVDCPYGAADCPKTQTLNDRVEAINKKLDWLIIVFVMLHGAELAALFSL